MKNNILNSLRFLGLPMKNFESALTVFKEALDEKSAAVSDSEIETLFFLGEPFLFTLAKGENQDNAKKKTWEVAEYYGRSIKISTSTFLFYRCITVELFSFDYNKVTHSLYTLFGLVCPLFTRSNDVDARLLLFVEVLGKEALEDAIGELKKQEVKEVFVLPYTENELVTWSDNLGLELVEIKTKLNTFSNSFDLGQINTLEESPEYLKVLPLFAPCLNALSFPDGEGRQKSGYVVQGNLSNILFFIMEESLQFNKISSMESSKERLIPMLMAKLEIFAYFMRIDFTLRDESYDVLLFELLTLYFGEDKSMKYQKEVMVALGHFSSSFNTPSE